MMKKARWIPPVLAALFLVPWAWAASQVVGVDGSVYSVGVVELRAPASGDATALTYSVLRPDGRVDSGFVPPTDDLLADRDPTLVLPPGEGGPLLIWTRNDGVYDQVAYSRYTGTLWTEVQYLTYGPRDHIHPEFGVDSQGTGYLLWTEPAGGGSVMIATFDPLSGVLLSGPRDLLRELASHSPPEWLAQGRDSHGVADRALGINTDPLPEGGNDTPAIPPCSESSTSNCKAESSGRGNLSVSSSCRLVVTIVEKRKTLHIGLLENGAVLRYYRAVFPAGAPEGYVDMLQESLLELNCHPL